MVQVNVTKRYKIEIDGTQEAYIQLADTLTDEGLDSLDIGDATGAFVEYVDQTENKCNEHGEYVLEGHGCKVTVEYEYDLFDWLVPASWICPTDTNLAEDIEND